MKQHWLIEYREGLRLLSRHAPKDALEKFRISNAHCPEKQAAALGKVLFFTGVAAWKTGLPNCAIGNWVQAVRVRKHRYAADHLNRFANVYGMMRQDSPDLDDKYVFFGIHLTRYVAKKSSGRLGTLAEIDMIHDLLEDSWRSLLGKTRINGRAPEEKIELFRRTRVVFPFFEVPDSIDAGTIYVDFERKKRIDYRDRCVCGSGLPFLQCHGRTRGVDELRAGIF